MEYQITIHENETNAEGLETLYQAAQREQAGSAFRTALLAAYESAPDNLLLAAWYYRLRETPEVEKSGRDTHWLVAIPVAVITGLIFWWLSDFDFLVLEQVPVLALYGAPIAAIAMMAFLVIAGKRAVLPSLLIGLGLLAFPVYANLISPIQRVFLQESYLTMAIPHIALLAWIGVGMSVLGRRAGGQARFAFILKSFEVLVTGGLFAIAGGIFASISIGMFSALGIDIPEIILRLIFAGGAGALVVIVVAAVYDPALGPLAQSFGQGVSRLMPTLVRLLLPLTFVVLVIYVAFTPFNFRAPIENREVLILNNGMLFAVIGLLMGATPLHEEDIPRQLRAWMRRGIMAVASLAIIISLHALTAILFRTYDAGILTMNRAIVIGWNIANLGILITLLALQFKRGQAQWAAALHKTFSLGSVVYLVWGLFVIIAIPLLFR